MLNSLGAKTAMEASEAPMGRISEDLEVRHCRVLVAVADTGGVAAAARVLGVAQSTVSETLLSLERLLGTPVTLRRPGRGATLTAAAETLIPRARSLISASKAAVASVAPQGQRAIRFGAVELISSFLLPGPLSAFRRLWPDVDVRITIGLCENLRVGVARSELDAALTIEGAAQLREGSDGTDMSPTRLRLIVAPRHHLTHGVVTRRSLERGTFLLTDHEGAFHALLDSWLGGAGCPPRLELAGSIDGVKRGVFNSEAIGILPDYAVGEELEVGALVALKLQNPPPPIALRLTMEKPPHAGSPLESLIGKIREALPRLDASH